MIEKTEIAQICYKSLTSCLLIRSNRKKNKFYHSSLVYSPCEVPYTVSMFLKLMHNQLLMLSLVVPP